MDLITKSNFFDDVFDNTFLNTNIMKSDIYEKDNNYIIETDLPGFLKSDINICYDNNYLTIDAMKNREVNTNDKYIKRERYTGKYKRSFYVGNINEMDIKAKYENGILTIKIPKVSEKEINKRKIIID